MSEYRYIAVTNGSIRYSTAVLRIDSKGIIMQYDETLGEWRSADPGMGGIYCGAVECETITKEEAFELIESWSKNAN